MVGCAGGGAVVWNQRRAETGTCLSRFLEGGAFIVMCFLGLEKA